LISSGTTMIRKFMNVVRTRGVVEACRTASRRLWPKYLRCWADSSILFSDKTGLEIGGPSSVFYRSGLLPVYSVSARVDNCNFSRQTVWEGRIEEGETFRFSEQREPGRQFITEATSLHMVASETYDFVLSSHTLEHIANPLMALAEWKRVLKPNGVLALLVPHKERTFDHRRPVTTLAHLIHDFETQTLESDLTHLEESLRLHDLTLDSGSTDFAGFKRRSECNFGHRCLHHHVFDTALAVEVVHHAGLQILAVEAMRPYHIFVLAQKTGCNVDNDDFRGPEAACRSRSPFSLDRL
jgi:SAM-dependent methyltransferase